MPFVRSWFLSVSVLSALTGVLAAGCGARSDGRAGEVSASTATPDPVAPLAKNFESRYAIQLVWRSKVPTRWKLSYSLATPDDQADLAAFASELYSEFGRYSETFRRALGVRVIALYKGLRVNGVEDGGVADTATRTMIFDFEPTTLGLAGLQAQVHHEFLHYAIGVFKGSQNWADPVWDEANHPGFKYGRGGLADRDPSGSLLSHPLGGFVDTYAEASQQEDMAEIFQCLFVPQSRGLLSVWSALDPLLHRKTLRLIQILHPHGFYLPPFQPPSVPDSPYASVPQAPLFEAPQPNLKDMPGVYIGTFEMEPPIEHPPYDADFAALYEKVAAHVYRSEAYVLRLEENGGCTAFWANPVTGLATTAIGHARWRAGLPLGYLVVNIAGLPSEDSFNLPEVTESEGLFAYGNLLEANEMIGLAVLQKVGASPSTAVRKLIGARRRASIQLSRPRAQEGRS